MSSFRKPITAFIRQPGKYVDGYWQEGAELEETISASVQPLKPSDLAALPEGQRREGKMVKIYTSAKLSPAEPETEKTGDSILWRGSRYLIIGEDEFQMDVISHNKYYAREEAPR